MTKKYLPYISLENSKEHLSNYISLMDKDSFRDMFFANLWEHRNYLDDYEQKVIQLTGERRTAADKHLDKLNSFWNIISNEFMAKTAYRMRCKKLEEERFAFAEKIKTLEQRIKVLEKMDKF